MKAVMYTRVSSKEQLKEGFSIPAQRALLSRYAKEHGIAVVQEFSDDETAKTTGRTDFTRMVNYLKKHEKARVILVEKTDRLHRNLKDYLTLEELDVEIHFVKEGSVISPTS
ncbi:MAG TPA: recombinase family protein, partial [Burkholderiales bacterium]|nr:recombinase family protein [Burkholderiales bacterium]